MTRKQKKMLCRILISFLLFIAAVLLPTVWLSGPIPLLSVVQDRNGCGAYALARWPMFLIPYLVIGWDVLWKAIRNILNGQIFDENFLMSVATIGALLIGEYPEAVAVMLFYQVGELFQNVAVSRSRQSISDLMDIRPDYANIEREGQLVQVDPEEVAVGDVIVIKAGERVPLDGTVLEGTSALDTAALTGESLPRDV
ncbi:MAG: heavy metal translocating P-type ATPase, partial [Lawsonibacter sp.]|nr:heavy metal translocating P-type ATPase [Lawsonibacter sp.]